MFTHSSIRKQLSRNLRNRQKAVARFRPRIEVLEDRLTPAYPGFTPLIAANPFSGVDVGFNSMPALGDVDGDGDLDAVVGESTGLLFYFENIGTANSPVYTQQTGAANPFNGIDVGLTAAPALGDVDGDGDLDAVVGERYGTLRYYKNIGTATSPVYSQQVGAANPFNGISVGDQSTPALADVDSDGDLDAVVGERFGSLRYYKNTGTANSPVYVQQTGAANPFNGISIGDFSTPALGDMDGDGDLDLLVGEAHGRLIYFLNTGTATSPVYTQQIGTTNPFNGIDVGSFSAPAFGDIDGDADPDLLVGNSDGTVFAFRNDASRPPVNYTLLTGSADPFSSINVGSYASPALGDVDGDGDIDVVVGKSDGTLIYYKNTGTATSPNYVMQSAAVSPFGGVDAGNYSAPALGDVDGDGDLDLVVGNSAGTLIYYRNTGTATSPIYLRQWFSDHPFADIDVFYSSRPALADVDGDGDLDAIVGDYYSNAVYGATIHYYKNTGTAISPVYVEQTDTANPFRGAATGFRGYSAAPALGDVDGDGDLDLIVGERFGTLHYFKNIGTTLSPVYSQQVGAADPFKGIDVGDDSTPALGDVDGDGDLDALVGGIFGTLLYLRNNRAPLLDNAIPDQTFTGPGNHSYTVPGDTFLDLDKDALTYSASLSNGLALPTWLTFDPATRFFIGNPKTSDASPIEVRVTATDPDGKSVFDDFQITLVDVADDNQAPTDIAISNTTVAENLPPGTIIGSFRTTDPDAGDTFTYSLASGIGDDGNAFFTITTNQLHTATSFDFETRSSYSIRVRSTDAGRLSLEKVFVITVSNVPEIALSNASVAENQPPGTLVGMLSTDGDESPAYVLVSGAGDADNTWFQITGNSLRTAASFDFETRSSYSIRVRSTDSRGSAVENVFLVTVSNVPEIALSNASVAENQPPGAVVGMLSTDGDASPNYALVSGEGDTDNASFQIAGNSLQTTASFDFEAKSSYSIRVRSADAAGLNVEMALTISIIDAIDQPPTDIALNHQIVAENQPAGSVVGAFSTTDADHGDSHTYTLVSGEGDTDNASFQIAGNSLRTTASFDFETKSSYSIRVRSTDSIGLFVEKVFAITVSNVPEIALSHARVAENLPAGTLVGTLSTDSDESPTYVLVSGEGAADNASFQIVGNSLQTAVPLDFEAKAAHSIRVRSTDAGGLSTESVFTIWA